jgi:RNA polymerase sigma factor (sigma-70 family)
MFFGRTGRATGLLETLVSAANLGILTAVDRFDPAFGTRLITYADGWIRERIRAELDTMGLVRISKARQTEHRHQQDHSAAPLIIYEDASVAEGLPHHENSEENLVNTYGRDIVLEAIAKLEISLRDKYILLACTGIKDDPKPIAQIASQVGLSGEGVRKIKRRALELLREKLAARDVNGSTDLFTSA